MKELIDFSSLNETFGLAPMEPVLVDWDECSTITAEAHPWNKGREHDEASRAAMRALSHVLALCVLCSGPRLLRGSGMEKSLEKFGFKKKPI